MDEIKTWTVDCETDWGGRVNETTGMHYGIPIILKKFKDYGVKGLFFINCTTILSCLNLIRNIIDEGHEIGSHGLIHRKDMIPIEEWVDYVYSKKIIGSLFNTNHFIQYRSPGFKNTSIHEMYNHQEMWTSILRLSWGMEKDTDHYYIHPFDIAGSRKNAPNAFCKLLYARPKKVMKTFENMLYKSTINV